MLKKLSIKPIPLLLLLKLDALVPEKVFSFKLAQS
jgi:hypothetical protein